MNRRGGCSVCDHPNLRAITTDLMARTPYRTSNPGIPFRARQLIGTCENTSRREYKY